VTHITTKWTEKGDPMKKTPFILHEKFRSDNNEQRKERFQKEFERYIIDGLLNGVPSRACT
jgi:hypothetical protein